MKETELPYNGRLNLREDALDRWFEEASEAGDNHQWQTPYSGRRTLIWASAGTVNEGRDSSSLQAATGIAIVESQWRTFMWKEVG